MAVQSPRVRCGGTNGPGRDAARRLKRTHFRSRRRSKIFPASWPPTPSKCRA